MKKFKGQNKFLTGRTV